MLAQDPFTGCIHEVPDEGVGQVVYDGLGNPVGMMPGLFDSLKNIIGSLPIVGNLMSNLMPGGAPAMPAPAVPAAPASLGQVVYDGLGNPVGMLPGLFDPIRSVVSNIPIVGGLVSNLLPGSSPAQAVPAAPAVVAPPALSTYARPYPFRRCATPVGWTTPALPYTGNAPRRLYLRCSVWPGQSGMVPTQPGTWGLTPQQATAQAAAAQAAARGFGRRRHHRRRR